MAFAVNFFKSTLACAIALLCLVVFVLQATQAYAAGENHHIEDLAVVVDKSGKETIDSISQPSRAADFSPVPNGFSGGYSRSVHWLRFTLHAPAPNTQGKRELLLEIQPPYLDDLQIYLSQPQASGSFDVRRGGDLQPQSAKEFPYRGFVYRVAFLDDRPRTTYVRLQTSSSSVLIVETWDPEVFISKILREYILLGLLFGLILTGLVANIWHCLWRREEIYRRYIAYLFATLLNLLGINGMVSQFLMPEMPFWADKWVPLGIILIVIFATRFYILALDIAHAAPWMRWVYRIQFWLAVACLPAPFMGFYLEAAQVLLSFVLVMTLTGTWRSIQLWRQGDENAKILLLAHLFGLSGNLAAIPALFGWLPGQFSLIYGFQLRSVAALLVLQLILAKHVRAMQDKLTQASVAIEIAKGKARHERDEREQQRLFLSMLTHELKTPLSIIRMRLGTNSPTPRMQVHAERAVEDIDAIVGRCAIVGQLDEEPEQLKRGLCQIDELVNEILAQQRVAQRVTVQIADAVLTAALQSDPLLLRTIFSNLIDNAVKYSPPGAMVVISATLSPQASRHGVLIRVENAMTKAGMPDPLRIFEKYYRAPAAHQQSGSGLGLYIAKALAVKLGGTLNYLPETNRVIFELWLPL
jgi:signal transduction histidine kinase